MYIILNIFVMSCYYTIKKFDIFFLLLSLSSTNSIHFVLNYASPMVSRVRTIPALWPAGIGRVRAQANECDVFACVSLA